MESREFFKFSAFLKNIFNEKTNKTID